MVGGGQEANKKFCEQNLYSMSSTIECVGREGVWSHGGRKGCGPMVEGRGVVPWWKEGCGPMVEGRGVVPWWKEGVWSHGGRKGCGPMEGVWSHGGMEFT